jgi:hypothetical protein
MDIPRFRLRLNAIFFFVRGCRLAELRYKTIDPNQFLFFFETGEKTAKENTGQGPESPAAKDCFFDIFPGRFGGFFFC